MAVSTLSIGCAARNILAMDVNISLLVHYSLALFCIGFLDPKRKISQILTILTFRPAVPIGRRSTYQKLKWKTLSCWCPIRASVVVFQTLRPD
jgi:hypothetical protein